MLPFFFAFGFNILYIFIILIIFWLLLVLFCKDGDIHFNGLNKENDSTISDKLFNRFYFSTVTLTTLGYGDISPKSRTARTITLVFVLIIFLTLSTTFLNYVNH